MRAGVADSRSRWQARSSMSTHAKAPAKRRPDESAALLRRSCAKCGTAPSACSTCSREEPELRRSGGGRAPAQVPSIVDSVLAGAGQPLDSNTRAFMERGFGHNFAHVRVHTDANAAASARSVGAAAYNVGRHVVFGAGRYAPGRPEGQELLAHELAHVVQGGAEAPARELSISDPSDHDERQADALAKHVASGARAGSAAPRDAGRTLRRSVAESVVSEFLPDPSCAQACIVHVHGDEQNAYETAASLRSTHRVNFLHLSANPDREIHLGPGHSCEADPNRIFTAAGRGSEALLPGCSDPAAARSDLDAFSSTFLSALSDCRAGAGGPLPVVAFHNNDPTGGLSIRSYKRRGSEAGATERDRSRRTPAGASGPVTNPAINAREDADNFFLTTALDDQQALSSGVPGGSGRAYNAVLQSTSPTDDGSLSVYMAQQAAATGTAERYINIEAEKKTFTPATASPSGGAPVPSTAFANNLEMGLDVMRLLGVEPQPCPERAPIASREPVLRRSEVRERETERTPAPAQDAQRDAGAEPDAAPGPEPAQDREETSEQPLTFRALIERIIRLIEEIIRVLQTEQNRPPARTPADPIPPSSPECLTFADATAVDAQKAAWTALIAAAPPEEIVEWIIGRGSGLLFDRARAESQAQLSCMLAALQTAASAPGSGIALDPRSPQVLGNSGEWGFRGFGRQNTIWERKFDFTVRTPTTPVDLTDTNGNAFDRISDHARRTCGSLLGSETKWNPENPAHRVAWDAPAIGATTAPPMPAGARALTADERQAEILQASSAPGISRHHFGTDADLFSDEPEDFRNGGQFADEYSWLRTNAIAYGFIQSFTSTSQFMGLGYMEERWHWSYYPIAQALVEYAAAHIPDIELALDTAWGTSSRFSYIREHWQEYMFNVHQRPTNP